MLVADDVVIDPQEAPMVPARTPMSFSELGISVLEFRPGESSIEGTSIRTVNGQRLVDRKEKPTTVEMILEVKEDADVDLPTAAYRLQQKFGSMQERETWIMRVPQVGGDFAGPILYRITGIVSLGDFAEWGRGDLRDVRVVLERDPVGYRTDEREQGPFTSAVRARHLIFDEEPSPGTAKGLWRGVVTNEGPEDWRGLILSRECATAPDDLDDPTAQPHYLARDLTLRGGSEIAAPTAPEVRAVGAVSSGTGAISPGLPAGTEAGDLLIMVAESGGATAAEEANTALTAAGWASPPAPYSDQKKGNTRLTVLYRVASGEDPTTTSNTGDHQIAKIIGIKAGTFEPDDPFNTAAVGTLNATAIVSIPGGTTTLDNCLILACATGNLPDAAGTAEFGAPTNASLSSLTERIDNTTSAGDGGALYTASGVKAAKGAYSPTLLFAATSAERAVASLAINPPAYVEHDELTAGWITILDSEIAGVGHMTHRGPRRMWFRIEDPGSEPGGVELQLVWRALGASRWDDSLPIVSTPVVDGWIPVTLGVARPQLAVTGDERWEWRLQARAPGGTGSIRLRDFYPASTEQYAVLQETYEAPVADHQSQKSPGTVVDDSSTGTITWTNPGNAKVSDNSYATAKFPTETGRSHYLKATNFSFSLPESAVVLGIVAAIEKASNANPEFLNQIVRDYRVRIVKGGVIGATERRNGLSPLPITDTLESYGASNDLWGESWTAADVNSANFGVAYAAEQLVTSPFETTVRVDAISLTVFYTEGSGDDRVCYATRSAEVRSDLVQRQGVTDDVWGVLIPQGFAPWIPQGGLEGKLCRTILIPSAGDFEAIPDGATTSIRATTFSRDGYHFAREAA